MDPWSKVDYSWIIWEASMVVEKLSEVNPPSGRVLGRGLLVLPIFEAQWRRSREEIRDAGVSPRVCGTRCKSRPKGAPGGGPTFQAPRWRSQEGGRATWLPAWGLAPRCS